MRRRKAVWKSNDIFAIPLSNKKFVVGHILDQRMVNSVRIAIYTEIIDDFKNVILKDLVQEIDLISLIEVTREQLDYNIWPIIGYKENVISVSKFANEQYRHNKWINSLVYDAALAEDFVNAFYSLQIWDDWYDPNYLDKFLIDLSRKPKNLIYKTANGIH